MDNDAALWEQAKQRGLPWFRCVRRSTSPEQVDRELLGTHLESEWLRLKDRIEERDELWPFQFNVRGYLGLRKGYVLLRRGRPVGGIVTLMS